MAVLQKTSIKDSDCSVVIPTYNRPHLALIAASTIRKFHPTIEIIVVDQKNSSPIEEKKATVLNISYYNLSTVNTSEAKNKGIMQAKGSIIFFFDDDIEITKDTIPEHLAAYSDESVVGTCGRVFNDGEEVPTNTDVETGKTNILGTKFLLQFWSSRDQYIDFPYGCNMSFRKDTLTKVKGFDKKFPKIFEEIDLGVRISRHEGKLKFVSRALAYHHKAQTGGTRTDPRNKQKMIYSHYGTYIAKDVPFPLSIISLLLRTKTVLFESPFAIGELYRGYISYILVR